MGKRAAEGQLTKDSCAEPEDGDKEQEQGTWAAASTDELKNRKIFKVKRRGTSSSSSSSAKPSFSFGAPAAPAEAKPENVEEGKKVEEKKEENVEKVPVVNAFAALVKKGWECSICYLRNKESSKECSACKAWLCDKCKNVNEQGKDCECGEKPPGAGTASKAELAAKFGGGESSGNFSLGSTSSGGFTFGSSSDSKSGGFTFGAPAKADSEAPTFGTGASSSSAQSSSNGPTFGFSAAAASSGPTFGFSAVAAKGASNITFGSVASKLDPAKSGFEKQDFSKFKAKTDEAFAQKSETKEMFKNKKAEESGKNKGTTVHKVHAMTYKMATDDKGAQSWAESGAGDLLIKKIEEGGKKLGQVLLWREKTLQNVISAPIFKQMKFVQPPEGKKFVRFGALDPTSGKTTFFLLKLKTSADASEVVKAMQEVVDFVDV